MSKKKLGSFNYWIIELLNFFILSYVCHDMNIFWPVSSVKFPRRYWTEFNQSWKTLLSHEIFQSLIDLNGANVGFRSNSRDWVFRIFMMSKINPLMSKNLLFLQLLVNHMIKELYLQNWVPRLEVLHSFLSKGSTWYVHLRFFAWCVNSILYLHKNNRNVIPQSMNIWLFLMHWVIYLYQNCIDSAVLILSNVMWNIRNEVDKTFVRAK